MPKPSPFTIDTADAELSFTFYFRLNGTLRRTVTHDVPGERRPCNSELKAYFSSDFLDKLVVAHFHLAPTQDSVAVGPYAEDVYPNEFRAYRFVPLQPIQRQNGEGYFDSISPIEITVFKNGNVAVTLRFQNVDAIPATALVSLIRHPEFLGMPDPPLTTGSFVQAAATRLESHWPRIRSSLRSLGLECLTLGKGNWVACEPDLPEEMDPSRWSRPYVGTLFRLRTHPANLNRERVRCFVIAAGRPTPSFVENFEESEPYLKAGLRNVYGPGNSIVFIGRRGWCVYDALDHSPDAFRLGVVSTTEFVISAFDTSARGLRTYAVAVQEEGRDAFKQLNIAVNYLVTGLQGRWDCLRDALTNGDTGLVFERSRSGNFRRVMACLSPWFPLGRAMAEATSFVARARLVSPCEDMIGLIETHLTSHSARAAVARIKQLTDFEALARASRESMANYTAFLKTSADYLSLRTIRFNRVMLVLGVIGVFLTLLGVLDELRQLVARTSS